MKYHYQHVLILNHNNQPNLKIIMIYQQKTSAHNQKSTSTASSNSNKQNQSSNHPRLVTPVAIVPGRATGGATASSSSSSSSRIRPCAWSWGWHKKVGLEGRETHGETREVNEAMELKAGNFVFGIRGRKWIGRYTIFIQYEKVQEWCTQNIYMIPIDSEDTSIYMYI